MKGIFGFSLTSLLIFLHFDVQSSHAIPVPEGYLALDLGQVDFPVSTTNAHAASWFQYGLLQLFCFGYDYATPAFAQAREEDPGFALAYAFEALTHFWPLWSYDDTETANQLLDEMRMQSTATMDDRESLYINAIVAHFNTSIDDVAERYETAVLALDLVPESYPEDPTGFAFLGLWRLQLSSLQSGEEASATSTKAVENLNDCLALQPTHPGALHYSLHAYDNTQPDIYLLGVPAAELYPVIAPGASHGAHMPMHILFRTGNYSACWDADYEALRAADLTCALYNRSTDESCDLWNLYHSVEYLQIEGYQSGQWQAATAMYERMYQNYTTARAKELDSADNLQLWWMRMEAREILEGQMTAGELFLLDANNNNLTCPAMLEPLEAGFWTSHTESGYLLARGLCQVFATDLTEETSQMELDETKRRLAAIPGEFGGEDPTSGDYYNYLVNVIHVELLDASHYFAQGNLNDFHAVMANATLKEQSLDQYWTANSPTMLFLSAHELYGQLLLLTEAPDNNALAMEQFLLADGTQGLQLSTMLGKARASEDGSEEAADFYTQAFNMLHPNHDEADLPFWEEMILLVEPQAESSSSESSESSAPAEGETASPETTQTESPQQGATAAPTSAARAAQARDTQALLVFSVTTALAFLVGS